VTSPDARARTWALRLGVVVVLGLGLWFLVDRLAAADVRGLIVDANVVAAAGIAFVAGIVSFASPCVVPLVPGYLSFMTGLSGEDIVEGGATTKGKVLVGSLLFVAGFAIPFTMIGVAIGALTFLQTNTVAQVVMGLLVIAFGVLMASGRLMREVRLLDQAPGGGVAGAPVLGFVFGVAWTPCVGPALGAILTIAAGGGTLRGGTLAFIFALGLGLPFILVGVAFRRMSGALDLVKRNARTLQLAGGGVLALVGVAIVFGWWDRFIIWLRPLIVGFEPPI
jgi:cytochrome c-type biogenesis protein